MSVVMRYLPFLLVLALWIYAFIDCLTTPEEKVRNLPKVVWVLIILLFGEVLFGPIAWLIAGRPRFAVPGAGRGPLPYTAGGFVAPDDNPEFLRSLGRQRRDEEDDEDKS
jgi:Phospholipase_D-nuclease N-terminal